MTIKEALFFGAQKLKKLEGPHFEAAVLLSAATDKPKEFIYTYPEKKLTPAEASKFKKFIARRAKHEPVAYITGKKEFYGFEFLVNRHVLIPRPDTEILINAVVQEMSLRGANATKQSHEIATASGLAMTTILDIGTGSGAIAITLKKLLPKARVFASDISPVALALAKKNARRLVPPKAGLGAKIIFKKGGLLQNVQYRRLHIKNLIITANLPYLSEKEWQKTAPEVKKYEPKGALVGGKHGWEIYEKLFRELFAAFACNSQIKFAWPIRQGIVNYHSHRVYLFIEIGHNQKTAIAKLAEKILRPQKIEFFKDLAGKWRVAKITLTKS